MFGCIAHVHIPDVHRKKLDNKSMKCVHLGVSEESKAYKLYDPVNKKIIVSRDVVFEESKGWMWNEESSTETIDVDFDNENGGNTEEIVETAANTSSESSDSEHNDEMKQTTMLRHLLQD